MIRWLTIGILLVTGLFAGRAVAATIVEDFSAPPAASGWKMFGNTNLFVWNSANQNLHVTWDSSQTNSYLHLPLGRVLTRADGFAASFDLTFDDYASGVTPGKSGACPAALGFFNFADAARTNFARGTGVSSTYGAKSLVEFNFFPEFSTFLPTIAQVVVSTNNQWLYNHSNLLPMTPGVTFHVKMTYAATSNTLTTIVTTNGVKYGATQSITVLASRDFRCDTFSISSYSDWLSTSSLLAHGTIDNLILTLPSLPVESLTGQFNGSNWMVQFTGLAGWNYTLERSTNLQAWANASATTPGFTGTMTLSDTNPPSGAAVYRVRAAQP